MRGAELGIPSQGGRVKSRDSRQGSPLARCSASGAKARLLRTLKSFVSIYSHNQVFIRVTMSSPESTAPEEAAADTQLRCESCDHAPFPSSKALHLHRAQHQLQADVTLPDGSSVILTRRSEAASWSCPEIACTYSSPMLLRLRTHLRDQRRKRRRQEEADSQHVEDGSSESSRVDTRIQSPSQLKSKQCRHRCVLDYARLRVSPSVWLVK